MRSTGTTIIVAMALSAGSAHAALVISDAATSNVQCTAGTCTATAADAVLNIHDLKAALLAGDLTVSAGSDAADIAVAGKLKWAHSHRLTLSAFHSVILSDTVTVQGSGGVTIAPNAGGGGDLVFAGEGRLIFWDTASSLVIAGDGYMLVSDIGGLAAAVAADPSGHYALARDFDAQGASYADTAVSAHFAGTFNGLGNAVANVQIAFNSHDAASGFFGSIDSSGVVRDFTLRNLVLTPTHNPLHGSAGALAGGNGGLVSNVTVEDGRVDARSARRNTAVDGGLVGWNGGTITGSRVLRTLVLGSEMIGGLVGQNFNMITRSRAEAVVQGTPGCMAGGLVGSQHGTISLSSSAGSVSVLPDQKTTDGYERAGGLAGYGAGLIDRSYSTATIDGGSGTDGHGGDRAYTETGGLVGWMDFLLVTDSYARNAVSAVDGAANVQIGGLAGFAIDSRSEHSYAAGAVTCNNCVNLIAGGFFGEIIAPKVKASYWDADTSGQADACGNGDCPATVRGLTTEQFKRRLPRGFDPAIWAQSPDVNDGYPYLIDNPPQ